MVKLVPRRGTDFQESMFNLNFRVQAIIQFIVSRNSIATQFFLLIQTLVSI